MKKITLLLLFASLIATWAVQGQTTVVGSPLGQGIPNGAPGVTSGPMTPSVANVADAGVIGTNARLDQVEISLNHTFDGDLNIVLRSPSGTTLDLSLTNGGAGDNYTNTVFQDGGADITLAAAPFTGVFQPQGGTFAAAFAGEPINGNWQLEIDDTLGGDSGTFLNFELTYTVVNAVCQNITVQLDAAGNATISAGDVDGGSSGFTGLSVSPSAFNCTNVGPNSVTLTATNGSLSDSCTATVTIEDNIAPSAVCQNITVQLDAAGNASITAASVDGGSSDACGIASLAIDVSSFDCSNVGPNNVVLTVTDVNGNASSCTAVVTVEDNVAPNAVCQNITVQLDAAGSATITPGDVDGGSSDACGIASLAIDVSSFDCSNVGPNNVVLTVTDNNGNASSCTAVVTVEDNVAPNAVCQNISVQLDAAGSATITPGDVDGGSSDACGIASLAIDVSSFDCSNVGPNNVVLTVTDNNGNASSCTAVVTVEDNVPPVAVCQNITIQLDANGDASIVAADVDGGSTDACGIASLAIDIDTFDCSNVGPNNVVLTVTDVNGNASSCTAVVTVEDNVPPVAVCQNIDVFLDAAGTATIVAGDVDGGSTDACGIDTLDVDIDTFDCSDLGPNNVTLTVTDVNGNVSTCVAVVTVIDDIPPTINCPMDVVTSNDPGICGAEVFFADAVALDNCTVASVVQTAGLPSGSVFPIGVSTVEYTATDSSGNTSVCQFTITVTDDEPPVIACQDATYELDVNGMVTVNASDLIASATDNCGVASISFESLPGSLYAYYPWPVNGPDEIARYEYDPVTDAISLEDNPFGASGLGVVYSVDINPATGMAYMLGGDDFGEPRRLFEFDVATGTLGAEIATVVSSTGNPAPNTMAFGNDGTLYMAFGNGEVDTFDVGSGVSSAFANVPTFGAMGMTFDSDANRVIYAHTSSPIEFYEIDLAGTVTPLFNAFNPVCGSAQAMEYIGGGKIVAGTTFSCSTIYTIDLNTGTTSLVLNPDGFQNNIKSLVFVPGSAGGPSITFGCDDVGSQTFTIEVTDVNGNVSTCETTITVEDNIAPEIFCIGDPAQTDVMSNGSFETGDFTDWTAIDNPNPFLPWGVYAGNDGNGFFSNATPTDGAWLAGNGFDGESGEAVLYQDVSISAAASSAMLSWDENIDYDLASFCAGCVDRIYEVQVRDQSDNVLEVVQQVVAAANTIDDDNAWASLTADLSAYAGQDIRIAFWQQIPDDFSGPAKFAVDNVSLMVEEVTNPLQVDLDPNGMATIDASALLMGVNEACGWTATVGGVGAPMSLETTFAAGNNFNGNMFDINVINGVTFDSFDVHLEDGITDDIEVYFKMGSFVGFETDASAWTLLETATVTSAGLGAPTPLNMNLGLEIAAGETVAFYVTTTQGGLMQYTNGTAVGSVFASDANIEFLEGNGGEYPFNVTFSPRVWNGNIHYTEGDGLSTTIDFTCEDLGLNQIEVTVTDASGNSSTCIASVEVNDVTSPILVCQDIIIELDENGHAEVDPADLLASLPGTYEVITISSDNGSNAEGFTDLEVDVTEAADISFDWVYSTDDGPQWDSFGYLLNGVYTELTDPAGDLNQSGSAGPISVAPGDVFGFRSYSADGAFGAATTVVSNFMPGFEGQFDPDNWVLTLDNSDGDAYFVEIPGGPLSFDACGITVLAVDVTDVYCEDIGDPIPVMVFASDASGNIAACNAFITVVDAMGPMITCPEDQTVDPGEDNLFYEVPDYWGEGLATATDNCTDPVTILSQDPAPGDLIPDGVYTVTLTAEDEYGNVSTCEFELTVESVLGITDSKLDQAVGIYPNPAENQFTIHNSSSAVLNVANIYDVSGKLIRSVDLSQMATEQTIDVTLLASGVYMVHIIGEEASAIKRLLKE